MTTGNNHSRSKQLNKTLIVRTILREGPLSRRTIAEMTELTPATITNLSGELIQDGVIREVGDIDSQRAGRKSVALDVSPDSRFALGIHIRPDRIEAGIVNLKGQVVAGYRFPYEKAPDQRELVALLAKHVAHIMAENSQVPLIGIGIGSLGLVDFDKGEIISARNMGWEHVDLVAQLRQAIPPGLPLYLDNNVTTMALAEKLFGRAKHASNFIFIYLGRGIGAGLVSNNAIYRRGKTGSSEFGHMTYHPHGEACWCGNHGCLELYASGTVLLETFHMHHVRELADAALAGDDAVTEAIRSAGDKIGTCMASLNNLFYIEKAVIGGQLASEQLPLIASIRESFSKRSFLASPTDPVEILESGLKDDVGIIGAASLAFNEYFTTV
jgi:predicted NBD/HSP70 family sugar kinase